MIDLASRMHYFQLVCHAIVSSFSSLVTVLWYEHFDTFQKVELPAALSSEPKGTASTTIAQSLTTSSAVLADTKTERKISESIDLTGSGTPNVSILCYIMYLH